ncbi:MAG: hypothetical protein ABEJ28_01780 [Salinigranum sp.]
MRPPSTARQSTALAVLALVLLSSLAGCSSLASLGHSGPPAFAPGVTRERVTNASALAAADRAVLRNTSYTYSQNFTQRIDADGYHYAVDHDTRVWAAANGSFLYRHRGVVAGSEHASNRLDDLWSNGSVVVARTVNVDDGTVTYRRYRPPGPFSAANATWSRVDTTLVGARVVRTWNDSGREYARVRLNETRTSRMAAGNGTPVNATTVRTANVTIREDGFVRSLDSSVSGRRPLPAFANASGRTNDSATATGRSLARIHDEAHVRYTALGATRVPRPAWVDDALAATADLGFGEETSPRPANASSLRPRP